MKYEAFTGIGNDGDPSYSTSVTSVAARVVGGKQFYFRGSDGQRVLADKVVIVAGTSASILQRDRLWLPGESTGDDAWPVRRVDIAIDELGSTDYRRLYLHR